MKNNIYKSDMTSNIEILFPDHVTDKFQEFLMKKDKTNLDSRNAFCDIAIEMKKALSNLDNKIDELLK